MIGGLSFPFNTGLFAKWLHGRCRGIGNRNLRVESCLPLTAVANNPSIPCVATVAFKAVPTASARNWMQASVPAVGQDVTAVRLFAVLFVLPVRSEFAAPGVTFEFAFARKADSNDTPFIG